MVTTLFWQRSCATCAAAKGFLSAAEIEFDSVDVGTEAGRARWQEAGRPELPAVTTGEVTTVISSMAQLAAAVGRPAPAGAPVAQDAGESLAMLETWLTYLRLFSWEALSAPTPSRGRTLRELTVNVFSPFDLAPAAWETGILASPPDDDETRGRAFSSREELLDWAGGIARRWGYFLAAHEQLLDPERPIDSRRGHLQWGPFLASKRWHTAFHLRQLVAVAEQSGLPRPAGVLELASLPELELPADVF
jgi:glutaredoxin